MQKACHVPASALWSLCSRVPKVGGCPISYGTDLSIIPILMGMSIALALNASRWVFRTAAISRLEVLEGLTMTTRNRRTALYQ